MRDAAEPSVAWAEGEWTLIGWGVADERTAATSGEALRLAGALAAGAHGEGPWLGGLAFPTVEHGQDWAGFPAARFVRPARLERRRTAELTLAPSGDAAPSAALAMNGAWATLVRRATDGIAAGALEKVVLARALELSASARGWDVFRALCGAAAAKRHYYFRSAEGTCFTGASPETLIRWSGDRLDLDALAGSAPVGCSFTEKERREHQVVVRDVLQALEGLAVEPVAEPAVMELSYVRHLHTPVRAKVEAGFDFGRCLGRLFPTSAVAGTPRERALDFIAAHEGLERGWYAGAVGRIAPGDVDLAVALRCVLVEGDRARLYAGAGIVAGSHAQVEWDETARKVLPALRALNTAGSAAPEGRRP